MKKNTIKEGLQLACRRPTGLYVVTVTKVEDVAVEDLTQQVVHFTIEGYDGPWRLPVDAFAIIAHGADPVAEEEVE